MTSKSIQRCARLTSRPADLSYGGLGYHEVAILNSEPAKLVVWAKFLLVGPMVYLAAVLFAKLAVLAIYLRIFTFRSFRIACWALGAVLVANWFAFTLTAFMMCTPLNYLWNKKIVGGGHCFDIDSFYRWSTLPNIVTDVVMLILPIPVVWRLQTSRSIKIGLVLTFATGSLYVVIYSKEVSWNVLILGNRGLITSILRFANFFFYKPTSDPTRTGVYIYIYGIFECCTYNIAACLLTFRPLAMMFRKDGPLSLSRLRSKISTRDGSHISSRTSSVPLGNLGNNKFELLDRDKPGVMRSDTREDAV